MGKALQRAGGGKVTVEGLTADIVQAGKTITVKQGSKVVKTVIGELKTECVCNIYEGYNYTNQGYWVGYGSYGQQYGDYFDIQIHSNRNQSYGRFEYTLTLKQNFSGRLTALNFGLAVTIGGTAGINKYNTYDNISLLAGQTITFYYYTTGRDINSSVIIILEK